jgi:hypothetical protein
VARDRDGGRPCTDSGRRSHSEWQVFRLASIDAGLHALAWPSDPDTLFDEFRQCGVSFVKELSFIDDGLWGFEITDADGYVLAFFQVRNE